MPKITDRMRQRREKRNDAIRCQYNEMRKQGLRNDVIYKRLADLYTLAERWIEDICKRS